MRKSANVTIPEIERKHRVILNPKKVITVRCDYELFKRLNKKSQETGISLNKLTELAIEEYL